MDYYNKSLQSLEFFLTPENIENAIENYQKAAKGNGSRDRTVWYQESYPLIIGSFAKTRGSSQKGRWIARLALASSWVPTVPTPALEKNAMEELSRLEVDFYSQKLEAIDVVELEEETTFAVNGQALSLKTFLQLTDKVINGGGNWDKSLSTTTKILHFMCPQLFPMFDGNVNHKLFGNKYFNYQKYHSYVFALREFLQTTAHLELLREHAEKERVSLVRIIDILLAHGQKQ